MSIVFGLAFVLILILSSAFLLKFVQKKVFSFQGNHSNKLKIDDILYIEAKKKITVLNWEGKKYLILTTDNHSLLLDKIPFPAINSLSSN